jgi:hypothetical protein
MGYYTRGYYSSRRFEKYHGKEEQKGICKKGAKEDDKSNSVYPEELIGKT